MVAGEDASNGELQTLCWWVKDRRYESATKVLLSPQANENHKYILKLQMEWDIKCGLFLFADTTQDEWKSIRALCWTYFDKKDRKQALEKLARNGDAVAKSIVEEILHSKHMKLQVNFNEYW